MLIFTLSPINHRRHIRQTNKRTKTKTKPALNIHHRTVPTQTHHHKHNNITPPRLHIMHPLLLLLTTMPPSSSKYSSSSSSYSSPSSSYPAVNSSAASSTSSSSSTLCKHSPSATLDILILILVLISGTFLLSSYFAYIFNSLSLLLSSHSSLHVSFSFSFSFSYLLGFVSVFFLTFIFILFCCGPRSRKCAKPGCKGLKKAMEFDLQLQTEDCIKSNGAKEIDKLPWKGGTEGNPDYECLRAELRKMAPPNGRAVLLFRARCGCPIAKLEGWGPKRGRRHKKALANGGGVNGGGDHR